MSVAQQIGTIGNSLKVNNLPEASATTYGTGNRFYTLVGTQDGYETGHTYKTVVNDGVYSWADTEGGGGSGEPTLKYTLTEVIADPTKTDWNCFWFDDGTIYSSEFQSGTGAGSNTSKELVAFTLENGGKARIYANMVNGSNYGFGVSSAYNEQGYRRYGTYNYNNFKYIPFSSPIASITVNTTFASIAESTRKVVTDYIYCGTI